MFHLHGGWSSNQTYSLNWWYESPPHISISPVKTEIDWTPRKIRDIIDELLEHDVRIDMNRLLLTGNSMGGRGTIIVGAQMPDLFPYLFPGCPHHTPYPYTVFKDMIIEQKQYVKIGMSLVDPVSDAVLAREFASSLGEYGEMTITTQSTVHCGPTVRRWQQNVIREALESS